MTNNFKVNTQKAPENIYLWNVAIRKVTTQQNQDETPGRLKRRVLELLLQNHQFKSTVYTDYDKFLVSFDRLTATSGSSTTYNVNYYEQEESSPRPQPNTIIYTVTVTCAAPELPTQPLKQLMTNPGPVLPRADEYETVLNIMLLRYAGQSPDYTTAARGTKLFSVTDMSTRTDLGFGLWMYRGYVRRIRLLQGGLFLCLNTTASVMYEDSWVDYVIGKWEPPRANQSKMPQLEQFLRGVKVQGMFGDVHRIKSVVGVAHHPDSRAPLNASQVKFLCDRHPKTNATYNKETSVLEFFNLAYPTVKVRDPTFVLKVGSRDRPISWPACLCKIVPGQPFKKPLPFPQQAQQMIRAAARLPAANVKFIESEGFAMLGVRRPNPQAKDGDMASSPLQIRMEMETATARLLKPPTVHFLRNSMDPADAAKGQWNLRNRQFKQPGQWSKYTILVFKRANEGSIKNLPDFATMMESDISRYLNLPRARTQPTRLTPHEFVYPRDDPMSWLRTTFQNLVKQNIQYCFIIPSDRQWYGDIKTIADSVGVPHNHLSPQARQHCQGIDGRDCQLVAQVQPEAGRHQLVFGYERIQDSQGEKDNVRWNGRGTPTAWSNGECPQCCCSGCFDTANTSTVSRCDRATTSRRSQEEGNRNDPTVEQDVRFEA